MDWDGASGQFSDTPITEEVFRRDSIYVRCKNCRGVLYRAFTRDGLTACCRSEFTDERDDVFIPVYYR